MITLLRGLTYLLTGATAFAASLWSVQNGFFDPVPYNAVEMAEPPYYTETGHLMVHYTFNVTAAKCEIAGGIPFATFLADEREPLSFRPIRGAGQTEQRFEGLQHLRWEINLRDLRPDTIQIWTRHDCGGALVEQMMAEFEVPDDG